MFTRNYLVIYDIADDKRRRKLVKQLEKYGFRVQFSAFECILNPSRKKALIHGIDQVIETEDSVRIYKLPKSVYIVGKGEESFLSLPEIQFI